MTMECHNSDCPWHSCHIPGEEGPFCYEDECMQNTIEKRRQKSIEDV